MRFIVYGAGAIGGVVGARLFQSGHEVVLIARGDHGAAIRREGLRLQGIEGCASLPIPLVEHPSELEFQPEDVVLLAVKSQQSAQAVETLATYAPPDLALVTLQNGVENERLLLRHFGRVYAVCVICPTTHLEPGVVRADSSPLTGLLDVGCYPSGVDAMAEELSRSFATSTFQSILRPDIMRWKYNKLLMNLGNVLEALCGAESLKSDVAREVRAEGERVLLASGIDFASRDEERDRRAQWLTLWARSGSSTWQSLQRGAGSTECEYLNGEIVMLGRLAGVATPLNERLQLLARRAAATAQKPGSLTLADLELATNSWSAERPGS